MQDDRANELAPGAFDCICPLQYRLPLTVKEYRNQLRIDDCEGHWLVTLSGLLADERAAVMDLVRLANAYPRLRAALDKALEACKSLGAAANVSDTPIETPDFARRSGMGISAWGNLVHALQLAREVLDIGEKERDRRAQVSQAARGD